MGPEEAPEPSDLRVQPEAAHLISRLECLREQLTATMQEILDRCAGMDTVDEQGQRLLNAAIREIEDVDSRLYNIRHRL